MSLAVLDLVVIITTSRADIGRSKTGRRGQLHNENTLTHARFSRLIDSDISTPCSIWDQYKKSRTSWGINVLGSFLIEIEATDGTVGFATGFGGKHFQRELHRNGR